MHFHMNIVRRFLLHDALLLQRNSPLLVLCACVVCVCVYCVYMCVCVYVCLYLCLCLCTSYSSRSLVVRAVVIL
jgi:hypothetical protein